MDETEIRRALERVLASAGFARNARMSRFLQFLVEGHLAGKDDELKESSIAVEVFGRRPDYDPKLDSIVRTEASRLRARLTEYYVGVGATDPVVIEVPKGGYVPACRRREPSLDTLPTASPVPSAADQPVAPVERPRTPVLRRWLVGAAGVAAALAVIATLGAWRFARQPAPIRIAVVPLENHSQASSGDYFVDGLTDEIIRNLSVIDGLTVRSRTSSFALKGQPRNVREEARQLDVDYLLEGSVLRDGQQLRIDAQLVRASDDVPIWSGRFDRTLTDVFAIQDEISLGIVNNLRLNLGRGRRRYETSLDAYDSYLHANVLGMPTAVFEQIPAARETPDQRFARSIESFKAAIASDGRFAPAYAGLAQAYAIRSVQFPVNHPPDELANMRAAAERAVQLDPLLPEAQHALAMTYAREGQWARAEESFRTALDLDPNQATIRSDYAYWLLAVLGRHDDALRQLALAEKADPLALDLRLTTALVLIAAHRYDDAASYCQRLPAGSQCLARVRAAQERFADVVTLLADHPDLERNPQTRGFLGYAYARSDRRVEAQAMVAEARYPNEQALIFAGLGDTDRTLVALDRMAALGPQRIGLYLDYPELRALQGDARVKQLRQKIGLP